MSFVILLFTANLLSAQTLNLTANGQDPKAPNPVLFTGPGWVNWLGNGAVEAGIVPINNYDANRMAEINKWGAAYNQRITARNIGVINDDTHFFTPGTLLEENVPAALSKLSSTLSVVNVDFQGNSIREMVLVYNTATGAYDYDYLVHPNVGVKPYIVSTNPINGQVRLMGDPPCGQSSDTATMNMVINHLAHIVETTNNNTNQNSNTNTSANNGGNGLTPEQFIALTNALKPTVVVYAGNNNGNVTLPSNGSSNNSTSTQNSPFTQAQGWTPVATYTLGNTNSTPATATLSTNMTTTANTAACSSCASAVPTADLALIERQNQEANRLLAENNRLTAQGNKYAKSQRDLAIVDFVFDRGEFVVDQLEKTGVIKLPNQGGNVFNTYTTNNTGTTTADGGSSSDWNNGCPAGTTWNGIICQ